MRTTEQSRFISSTCRVGQFTFCCFFNDAVKILQSTNGLFITDWITNLNSTCQGSFGLNRFEGFKSINVTTI